MRRLLRTALCVLFRLLTRLTVEGRERIPTTGSCLLVSNHLGIIDGPLVFSLISRDDATGLVALDHKSNPIIRFVVETADGIWIDRERTDFRALKQARNFLKRGGLLGVAPEGTRSHTQSLIEAKAGVAFLADKSGAVVVPMAITGSEHALKKMFTLQRPKVTVRVGRPFHLPPLARDDRDGSLQRNTDEIMCRIAALLPEAYHGVYAGHPRLGQLLGDGE
jgi:1-acyl-sn-glycerol-3-phosphate acyltransferase